MFEKLLTVEELAQVLVVSPKSVYRYVAQSAIPFLRVGKHLRFDQAAVLSHLQKVASIETPPQVKKTVSLAEAREERATRRRVLSDKREGSLARKDTSNGN